ncbi:MAG: ABC transporter substrate-binding protein [Cyanothece sp. SIO2G6]|nr:ABC transporter substrate-binding protein [Cyanothece sp. SIO2G6]
MPKTARSMTLSLGIVAVALGMAYAPTPVAEQSITVLSGSELQEPLTQLEEKFEAAYPAIDVEIKIQGSRDIVNNYIDDQNDFTPTVLIPANGELLDELRDRWTAQSDKPVFYGEPQTIARTFLVSLAWPERGDRLFPSGTFDWDQVETALEQGQWGQIGGEDNWGSFDLVITDPSRSNSSQLALSLWSQNKTGSRSLTPTQLGTSDIADLFGLVKRSVYQPPRSTDILLQEFITRGPNEADIAFVYESIALYRWQQSAVTQNKAYQIYYLNPTIETASTAAIVTRDVNRATADAAQTFVDFLAAPEQQAVFVEFGFRPADASFDLTAVPNSPWSQNIPGAEIMAPSTVTAPDETTLSEIVRQWQRAQ